MALSETIQFQATPELRRQLEQGAGRLNLSLSEYIAYLPAQLALGVGIDVKPTEPAHDREPKG